MTASTVCLHCQTPVAAGEEFCCPGCKAAYGLIHQLGLGRYYSTRSLRDDTPPPTPDQTMEAESVTRFATQDKNSSWHLSLSIEGLHCAACVWLIEHVLAREEGVEEARLNMTTRRLSLRWRGERQRGGELTARILALGYRARPYDPTAEDTASTAEAKTLLRSLAIAGFAMGNIMLLSVALWSSTQREMGVATRDLLHWVSALIALPTILYAGTPFFHSALRALRHGRGNMDVPISLALIGATGMSLVETIYHGEHIYFDSAVMLLFFLLTGRYLDRRARNRARSAAQDLLAVMATGATVLEGGKSRFIPARDIVPGMRLLVAAGERIAADGEVIEGNSNLDNSLITGESLPQPAAPGDKAFAGTVNLDTPLTLRVTATHEGSLLAEIVRLMEQAEQGQARYVRLADRVARYYTPVVHLLGLSAFLFWWLGMGKDWQEALLVGITILIVTCPCALALAVPVVQVIASGRLFARGVLLKSGDALERLATIDRVALDKTGTLTLGHPILANRDAISSDHLCHAASMAANSHHPLARAVLAACPEAVPARNVREYPGEGLECDGTRLGKRSFVAPDTPDTPDGAMEIWLGGKGVTPVRFIFHDPLREDAAATVAAFAKAGIPAHLLSGDRKENVRNTAEACGITDWKAEQKPDEKLHQLTAWEDAGQHCLMVGDGLNDAPALAAAHVSMSPSSAIDITRNAADIVFQGNRLAPVFDTWRIARRAETLVRQNIAFSLLYNVVAIPLAMTGIITPLIAAVAMSSSSLVVILNALRLNRD